MHIADPNGLTDEEWASAYQELVWIRNKEHEEQSKQYGNRI